MTKKITPETALKRAARDFLRLHNIWSFPITAGLGSHPGVADRLGIYQGKPLAIEFKSIRGRLTPYQEVFKKEWESRGGIHITCWSIEDLAVGLKIKTLLS
ncbi:MAG: hypothetical protein ACYDHZ_00360 [Dehalococcoidia bacterium]